jgi:hypothetical protein
MAYDRFYATNLEESSKVAAGGEPFIQSDVDVVEAKKESNQRLAEEASARYGIPYSKAIKMIEMQDEVDQKKRDLDLDTKMHDLEETKRGLTEQSEFVNAMRDLNAIDHTDPMAQQKASAIYTRLAPLQVSKNKTIADSVQNAITQKDTLINRAVTLREAVRKEMEAPTRAAAIKVAEEAALIPMKASQAKEEAVLKLMSSATDALSEGEARQRIYGTKSEDKQFGGTSTLRVPAESGLQISGGLGTPVVGGAAPAPMKSATPAATPSSSEQTEPDSTTPLLEGEPSATTGKTQPREGQRFIQNGKTFEYRAGDYLPVD